MVTLADIQTDARSITAGSHISVKFALWMGLLSANAPLFLTNEQGKRLRPYINAPLPDDPKAIKRLLRNTGLTGKKLAGLYHIQALEDRGHLAGLQSIGTTYDAQRQWRDTVRLLMAGHGMAYKTISFAALLIDPFGCELVPVDRHVLARIGYPATYTKGTNESEKARQRYEFVEEWVRYERQTSSLYLISAALWHWLTWEQWRQGKGVSLATSGAESHQWLSCHF